MKKLFPDTISRIQFATAIFFAIVYSLISLVNHYNFRTSAYDMGLMNNAAYDYAHLRFNNCTLLQPELENYLSEHFELFIMLLSPFIYVFGTYTLLIFQILFVLFGGFGVYRYIKEISQNATTGFFAQLHFYFFFGIYSALSFDFHNNVLGAMIVPWFFYFFHKKKWKPAMLFFLFMISTKENIPLWMAFICAGISLLYWKDSIQRWAGFVFGAVAFVYFVLVVKLFMPSLANEGEAYVQIRNNYSAVGSSLGGIISTIFTRPLHVLELLFFNHSQNVSGDYYKAESWIFVLLSGGILFFVRPQFWIMLIPVFAQKMFHNDLLKWGVSAHYSIEFAPICSMGAFYVIAQLNNDKWRKHFSGAVVFLSLAVTIRSFDRTYTYFDRSQQRIYQSAHYSKDYDVAEAHRALKLIPGNAKVSAQSAFVPHLAFRDYIWQFPVINDAEYIVISFAEKFYPLNKESFSVQVAMLQSSGEWERVYDQNKMLILRRKPILSE